MQIGDITVENVEPVSIRKLPAAGQTYNSIFSSQVAINVKSGVDWVTSSASSKQDATATKTPLLQDLKDPATHEGVSGTTEESITHEPEVRRDFAGVTTWAPK